MLEKYYYCYSTNNELLSEYSKKLLKRIKHQDNLHDFTSFIANTLSLSSLIIDSGGKSISINIEEPFYKKEKLAKSILFSIKLNPVLEFKNDMVDEEYNFKKITQKLKNDDFSKISEEDFGDVLKYTSFLHLDNLNIDDKKDYNKHTTSLAISIFYFIKKGYIKRDDKLQLPIGKELFNIKFDCFAKY